MNGIILNGMNGYVEENGVVLDDNDVMVVDIEMEL